MTSSLQSIFLLENAIIRNHYKHSVTVNVRDTLSGLSNNFTFDEFNLMHRAILKYRSFVSNDEMLRRAIVYVQAFA